LSNNAFAADAGIVGFRRPDGLRSATDGTLVFPSLFFEKAVRHTEAMSQLTFGI